MWKTFIALLALVWASAGFAEDTVLNGKVWSVNYNTGSAFYSAMEGKQEITMECMLGDMRFGAVDQDTGDELIPGDEQVMLLIDNVYYKAPQTLAERRKFYEAVSNARDSFQLRSASGFVSKVFPIKELRTLLRSVEFDLSDCKE